jgi:hypothetical protein
MPTMRAKMVKGRKAYACDGPTCRHVIEKGEPHVAAVGYADRGDKPWMVRLCPRCASISNDAAILLAYRKGTK